MKCHILFSTKKIRKKYQQYRLLNVPIAELLPLMRRSSRSVITLKEPILTAADDNFFFIIIIYFFTEKCQDLFS